MKGLCRLTSCQSQLWKQTDKLTGDAKLSLAPFANLCLLSLSRRLAPQIFAALPRSLIYKQSLAFECVPVCERECVRVCVSVREQMEVSDTDKRAL